MRLHVSWSAVLVLVMLCSFISLTDSFDIKPSSPAAKTRDWQFQGHKVYAEAVTSLNNNRNKPAVLLIHGFGCSTTYWRETTSVLTQAGYEVHALDLLDKDNRINLEEQMELSIL